MVEVVRTLTFREDFEKYLKFLPILVKIMAPPNNIVQNDADLFKLCFCL